MLPSRGLIFWANLSPLNALFPGSPTAGGSIADRCDAPLVRMLADAGGDANLADCTGRTPLHFARVPEGLRWFRSSAAIRTRLTACITPR
jgi:hypothetical protein